MGSYEDRIRNFSSAERVFEFFASVTNEKGTFMTPADFARSITPYQHRIGEKVGSENPKYRFQAKHHGPTASELKGYKKVLKAILEDSRITFSVLPRTPRPFCDWLDRSGETRGGGGS
ncbi:conserved unknown protein [Ectocarpus siliculosus]|uniref:Uncharacterized protein n=1 Tax=Ectocarpus siliculosus TaxID=2880 RepID=D7FPD2_ECTSI|nr:conserved unknown protein [Ectocarpus siliculosus]|eukprot:CBJ30391.1 conserved unknown protein [Ectocarpus siliculosus]